MRNPAGRLANYGSSSSTASHSGSGSSNEAHPEAPEAISSSVSRQPSSAVSDGLLRHVDSDEDELLTAVAVVGIPYLANPLQRLRVSGDLCRVQRGKPRASGLQDQRISGDRKSAGHIMPGGQPDTPFARSTPSKQPSKIAASRAGWKGRRRR